MENKKKNIFIKIVGILGIVFCIVSLVAPWSSSAFTFGIFKEDYSSPLYLDFFTNQSIRDSNFSNQALFFGLAMIIIFIFMLLALIFGIISVVKVKDEVSVTFLLLSYLFIASVILYIIIVTVWEGNISYAGSSYNYGFFTAVIAFIIYFVLFLFRFIFYKHLKPIQKTVSKNDSIKISDNKKKKGEITK